MATTITPRSSRPIWWWIHDITVGLLSGFGVGTIAGLFLNRLVENNVVVLVCAIVGAAAGIYVLIENHRESRRFLSGIVIVSWVLLVLSAGFLALFIWAILNFE
jgi:ABC-type cobalamin transport system permease subunit